MYFRTIEKVIYSNEGINLELEEFMDMQEVAKRFGCETFLRIKEYEGPEGVVRFKQSDLDNLKKELWVIHDQLRGKPLELKIMRLIDMVAHSKDNYKTLISLAD